MRSDQFLIGRRGFMAGLAATASASALTGCFDGSPPRLTIVLVDITDSVTELDRGAYRVSFDNLVESIKARQAESQRDRLIVATIGDRPFTRFDRAIDATIAATGLVEDQVQIPAQRDKIKAQFARITPQPQSTATRIFDAVVGAADIIANNPGYTPELLLLSDMVEQFQIVDLSNCTLDDTGIDALLDRLGDEGLLPDLQQAAVHVSGGAGKDAAAYAAIRTVWQAYFIRTNARLSRYSRSPLSFGATG